MTKIKTPTYDLVEIEMRARQMRAEMTAAMFASLFAWLRKPRTISLPLQARTA